jgi:hypothetical protein
VCAVVLCVVLCVIRREKKSGEKIRKKGGGAFDLICEGKRADLTEPFPVAG